MRTQEEPKKLEIKQKINKWTEHFKKQSETDCEIQFQNEIRNNLNKLTPDNYEILKDIILDKIKNSEKKCNFLAQKIIEKAWNEQKYTKVYAKLCHFLQNAKELDEKNLCSSSKKRKNLFKSAILCKIQSIFEEDHTENDNCKLKND